MCKIMHAHNCLIPSYRHHHRHGNWREQKNRENKMEIQRRMSLECTRGLVAC